MTSPKRVGPHPIGAGAPARRVVDAALDSYLGGLSGRLWATPRALLAVLGRLVDQNTGTVTTTAAQLADRLGCDRRTAAAGLRRLEDLGVITWDRGGVTEGRPAPGVIRLHKAILCALIPLGLAALTAVITARAALTSARLAGLVEIDNNRRVRALRRRKRPGQATVQRLTTSALNEDYRPPTGPPVTDWRSTPRAADPSIATRGAATARRALQAGRIGASS